jgi:hypothetical protein
MVSKRVLSWFAAAVTGAGIAIASPAAAVDYIVSVGGDQIYPGGVDVGIAPSGNGQFTTPQSVGVSGSNYLASAQTSAAHGGVATATVRVAPIDTSYAYVQTLDAQSAILYHLTLQGTGTDSLVPIEIKAAGEINWAQDGFAEAGFRFIDYSNPTALQAVFKQVASGDPGTNRAAGSETLGIDQVVWVNPNDIFSTELYTDAHVEAREILSLTDWGTADAVVDPTFTVVGDYASRWTVVGAPASPSGGAPEPAGWIMLIAGFGLTGAAMRRHVRHTPMGQTAV